MCVHTCGGQLEFTSAGVIGSGEPTCVGAEISGPLQEQHTLLTAEPFLQFLHTTTEFLTQNDFFRIVCPWLFDLIFIMEEVPYPNLFSSIIP